MHALNDSIYKDENGYFHFKLVYPTSIFRHFPIFWKQKTHPLYFKEIEGFAHLPSSRGGGVGHPPENSTAFRRSKFYGLRLIDDNISAMGTVDSNGSVQNDIYRIGAYIPFSIGNKIPDRRNWGKEISVLAYGGLTSMVNNLSSEDSGAMILPRTSLESVQLYVRNHRKCRDEFDLCWLYGKKLIAKERGGGGKSGAQMCIGD